MEHQNNQLDQALRSVIFRQKLRDAELRQRQKEAKIFLFFEIIISILLLPFLLPVIIPCIIYCAGRWLYRKTFGHEN